MARQFTRGRPSVKQWQSMSGLSAQIGAAATVGGGILGFAQAATIIRMIGGYGVAVRATPVAGDISSVTVAIGVVSSDAAAVGASALPDPLGEPEYPWLYHRDHSLFFADGSIDPHSALGSFRTEFDIRSMRKIKPRESLVAVIQVASSGDPPLQFEMDLTRVLTIVH